MILLIYRRKLQTYHSFANKYSTLSTIQGGEGWCSKYLITSKNTHASSQKWYLPLTIRASQWDVSPASLQTENPQRTILYMCHTLQTTGHDHWLYYQQPRHIYKGIFQFCRRNYSSERLSHLLKVTQISDGRIRTHMQVFSFQTKIFWLHESRFSQDNLHQNSSTSTDFWRRRWPFRWSPRFLHYWKKRVKNTQWRNRPESLE